MFNKRLVLATLLTFGLGLTTGCKYFWGEIVVCWKTVNDEYVAFTGGGPECSFAVWSCYGDDYGTVEECCNAEFPEIDPPAGWSKEVDPLCNPQTDCDHEFFMCMHAIDPVKDEYHACQMEEPKDKDKCELLWINMQSMVKVCVSNFELCDPSNSAVPTTSEGNDTEVATTWTSGETQGSTGDMSPTTSDPSQASEETGLETDASFTDSDATEAPPICGNGVVEMGEGCDNGICAAGASDCFQGYCISQIGVKCNTDTPHPRELTCGQDCQPQDADI